MQRSLSYLGPHPRLRRLVARMLRGGDAPVKVGVVGGSISYGHGATQLGVTDWFSRLHQWMRRAFPASRLEFHNGCVPATPAAFMTLCLEHYVDPLADLVFVEVRERVVAWYSGGGEVGSILPHRAKSTLAQG